MLYLLNFVQLILQLILFDKNIWKVLTKQHIAFYSTQISPVDIHLLKVEICSKTQERHY